MNHKLVIVMVGLPARGKSYIAKKLCRFLNWLEYRTEVFNVGKRRRRLLLAADAFSGNLRQSEHMAAFFDPDDAQAQTIRQQVAMDTLKELISYLVSDQGDVGIFDATNSTQERRASIVQLVRDHAGPLLPVLFIESQCFDTKTLEANMLLKLSGPDYRSKDSMEALKDFRTRVQMYTSKYVPLGTLEEELGYSFCQTIDVGRKFILHNIQGNLAQKAVQFIQNFHLNPRMIWLAPSGRATEQGKQSWFHLEKYARGLSRLVDEQNAKWNIATSYDEDSLCSNPPSARTKTLLWTSTSTKCHSFACHFNSKHYAVKHLRVLSNPQKTPEEDRLDLVDRLLQVALEIERSSSHVLIIAGNDVLQLLLDYFQSSSKSDTDSPSFTEKTVLCLEPKPYGVQCQRFEWDSNTVTFSGT